MKKRTQNIVIELKEATYIGWNEKDKCIELRNSEGHVSDKHLVSIGEAYKREGKRPKVLRQFINPTGGVIGTDPKPIVYDRYLAVDTSYKPFGENYICTTGCLMLNQHLDHDKGINRGDAIIMNAPPPLIFLAKPGINPERYGWMKVIEGLLKSEFYNIDWSYGIVVDSDLKDLPKINAKEEPICDEFYCPDNISLIYASADVGKEHLTNKLIRATDKIANESLKIALASFEGKESEEIPNQFHALGSLNNEVHLSLQADLIKSLKANF